MREIIRQSEWHELRHIESEYPEAILLFRCQGGYEVFGSSAVRMQSLLPKLKTTIVSTTKGSWCFYLYFDEALLSDYLPALMLGKWKVAVADLRTSASKKEKIVQLEFDFT